MSKQGNLRGLVRLRSVRERDSRIGLATALAEERAATAAVADLEEMLRSLPTPAVFDLTAFQAHQHTVELIRAALSDARHVVETAGHVSAAARDRWVVDRTRLKAVESLVERRAAAARAERNRREVRDQDEVASDLWRRTLVAVSGGAS
jgi:flagellar export protein FliJ